MAENKKSFILYSDILLVVEKLPNEIAGKLFKVILEYVNDKNPVIKNDLLLEIAFEPIKMQLKRDLKKWDVFREKQSHNGKKGGRPEIPKPLIKKPNNPSLDSESQTSLTVNATVTDSVNVNGTVNVKKKKEKDVAPPLLEYAACVDYWLKEFHQGWDFGGQQGKALKSLIKKIKKILADGGKEVTEISVVESFKFMCRKLPEWYKTKDLPILDSKFNEIIQEIKTPNNGKSNTAGRNQELSFLKNEAKGFLGDSRY